MVGLNTKAAAPRRLLRLRAARAAPTITRGAAIVAAPSPWIRDRVYEDRRSRRSTEDEVAALQAAKRENEDDEPPRHRDVVG